jgi:hypothetical protein
VRFLRGFLIWTLVSVPGAFALVEEIPIEHKVKAAYLYNFVRFVEWPEVKAGQPFRVGVVGSNAIVSAVRQALDGRMVGDRTIVVKRVTAISESVDNEVLYIAGNDADTARKYVSPAAEKPVLTVTECDRFVRAGSLVNFYVADESVRFAVNTEALDRSPLRMSSQMLQFASIVKPAGE